MTIKEFGALCDATLNRYNAGLRSKDFADLKDTVGRVTYTILHLMTQNTSKSRVSVNGLYYQVSEYEVPEELAILFECRRVYFDKDAERSATPIYDAEKDLKLDFEIKDYYVLDPDEVRTLISKISTRNSSYCTRQLSAEYSNLSDLREVMIDDENALLLNSGARIGSGVAYLLGIKFPIDVKYVSTVKHLSLIKACEDLAWKREDKE